MRSLSVRRVERDRSSNSCVVTLRESDQPRRQFDIFVGVNEGMIIKMLLEGDSAPRPLTHDLFVMALERLSVSVKHVVLTHVSNGTFFAELVLQREGEGDTVVSCRPSDGIALAMRANSPVYGSDDLLDEVGREVETGNEESAEILDEFRDFIENISPDDFDI